MKAAESATRAGTEEGRDEAAAGVGRPRKKAYHPPRLERFGDLRTLTLGGSPGVGDSGGSFTEMV